MAGKNSKPFVSVIDYQAQLHDALLLAMQHFGVLHRHPFDGKFS